MEEFPWRQKFLENLPSTAISGAEAVPCLRMPQSMYITGKGMNNSSILSDD
jgi:hypothetical protein